MHKILVSHESPLTLLEESLSYNDYDYCLVHLLDKYPEYKSFFKRAVLSNRQVLLDNSIFELGVAFEPSEYAKQILELQPTFYIVPDVLEQSEATIRSWNTFVKAYPNLPGKKIGAVQGKTYQEIVECYKHMSDNADYIAISFDFSYYQLTGLGNTKFEKFVSGRQKLIQDLIDNCIWNWNKPHHLLGCALPQEFKHYIKHSVYNIRSCDTSNPVMAGITGLKYCSELGLNEKPKGLLADNLNIKLTDDQYDLIKYNIKEFKKIVAPYEN
jgi:hypothetical protein